MRSIQRAERTLADAPIAAGPEIGFATKRVGVLLDRLRLHLETDRLLAERRRDPIWEVGCDYAVLALGRLISRLRPSARDTLLVSEVAGVRNVAALRHGAPPVLARRSGRSRQSNRVRRLQKPPRASRTARSARR